MPEVAANIGAESTVSHLHHTDMCMLLSQCRGESDSATLDCHGMNLHVCTNLGERGRVGPSCPPWSEKLCLCGDGA